MRVHQLPIVPDRLPPERPQPRPEADARLRAAFADIVALRVNPRQQEERKPKRQPERDEPGADAAPEAAAGDAPARRVGPAPGAARIDLLT
jgi:hypothetical protein